MNKEKVKEFIKTHKKEIVAGVVTTVVGGCMYTIGKRAGLEGRFNSEVKLSDGSVACPGFHINEKLTIADIGKLGEEFIKHDSELTKDTQILEVGKFVFE